MLLSDWLPRHHRGHGPAPDIFSNTRWFRDLSGDRRMLDIARQFVGPAATPFRQPGGKRRQQSPSSGLGELMVQHMIFSVRAIVAVVAVLFGAVTLLAGGRVLLGEDPGYEVFRPLLIYNTAMGVAYIAGGITVVRNVSAGRRAAAAILLLNLLVLAGILVLSRRGAGVAVDSLRAMMLRTVVWLFLFLGPSWLVRRQTTPDNPRS